YKGEIDFKTPMWYAFSFLFLFTIGGLTGMFLGALSTDVHLHDTYFIVAHFHYVMMGGTVIALLGGIHYWWPKMFGRMYSEFWGKLTCLIIFIGFNMTFFTQFILGAQGMPRRYFDYPQQYQTLHGFSSIGAWILGLGFLIMFTYLIYSLFKGKIAPANPWGSLTMEWETTSPPHPHNFADEPTFKHGPYDYDRVLVSREEVETEPAVTG
ncbi:MAG: cytochrome c oxidase subunit I, partial [Candidatus Zixiibacteriota bacterium]